jgi:hypothetical protein
MRGDTPAHQSLRQERSPTTIDEGAHGDKPVGYGKPASLHQGEWKAIGRHPLNEALEHLASCNHTHPLFGHALSLAHALHEASSTPSTYGGQTTTTKPSHNLASYGKRMAIAARHLKSDPHPGMFGAFKSLGKMIAKAHKDAMKPINPEAKVRRQAIKEAIDFQMERFDELFRQRTKG